MSDLKQSRRFAVSACGEPRPYLNTQQAAHYLGIGWRKLMRLRTAGEGPVFRQHGRLIVYHPHDLDAWSQSTARKARP